MQLENVERQRRKDEYMRLKTLSRMQERAKRTEQLLTKRQKLLAQRKQIAIATKKQREVILRAMDEAKTKKNWKSASKKIAQAMSNDVLGVRVAMLEPPTPCLPPAHTIGVPHVPLHRAPKSARAGGKTAGWRSPCPTFVLAAAAAAATAHSRSSRTRRPLFAMKSARGRKRTSREERGQRARPNPRAPAPWSTSRRTRRSSTTACRRSVQATGRRCWDRVAEARPCQRSHTFRSRVVRGSTSKHGHLLFVPPETSALSTHDVK